MSIPVPVPPRLTPEEAALARWLVILQKALAEIQAGDGLPKFASDPPYKKGRLYFNTSLNKLRVGGASGWETVTSA